LVQVVDASSKKNLNEAKRVGSHPAKNRENTGQKRYRVLRKKVAKDGLSRRQCAPEIATVEIHNNIEDAPARAESCDGAIFHGCRRRPRSVSR
jgi:hypothetical protein